MAWDDLVDRVAKRTHGTRNDPLGREEVEQVVAATLAELAVDADTADVLPEPPVDDGRE